MSKKSSVPGSTDEKTTIIEERNSKGEVLQQYIKGRFLGKGGFAKCYEFTAVDTKRIYAAKVICKASLNRNRAKQKLMSEIKIHKSMKHEHIVNFEHVFEDNENVYILLEICTNETLGELIRRRKRLTELEAQSYMLQMLGAVKYLRGRRVIHRDLKLGNMFLSEKMEIKLGDFGLATRLDHDEEKRRTICGTPNYIAPEILEGKHGHSYEVDVWSLGVILYTLLIGKPPYETSDVQKTYSKIRSNQYSFPDNVPISAQAKNLITKTLVLDPSKRPSLDEMINNEFFTYNGTVPKLLPVSTLACPPSASYMKQFLASSSSKETTSYRSSSPQRFEGTMPVSVGPKPSLNERKDFMNTDRILKASNSTSNFNQVPSTLNHAISGSIKVDNLQLGKVSQSDKPLPSSTKNLLSLNTMQTMQDQLRSTKEDVIGSRKASEQNEDNFFHSPNIRQKSPGQPPLSTKNGTMGNQAYLTGADIWVKRWVDYSSKYGLGYLLSNGCIGVLFNDSTKILLEAKSSKFIYVERKGAQKQDAITEYTLPAYPEELQKKVTLLQHFKNYLEGEEAKSNDGQKETQETGTDLRGLIPVYVKKWLKTRNATMFRLSSKVVQVVFQDHTEIILSSELKIVTYVNKKHERLHYPLSTALQSSNQEMTKRLKYTKDILTHMLGGQGAGVMGANGDENKKTQSGTTHRNGRSSSNMQKDDVLVLSGEYSARRADSVSGFDGKASLRLSTQTGRPSLQTVPSNALLEKGL